MGAYSKNEISRRATEPQRIWDCAYLCASVSLCEYFFSEHSAAMTNTPRGQLLRLLGVTFGIAVAVGAMIGSGILRTPGLVAASVPIAGAILALWVFGAFHALLQANVLAELGASVPRAGGEYVFAHRALGDTGGVVVGWATWCARIVGLTANSIAFAEFLAILWPVAANHTAAVAIGLQLALFAANVSGLREGRALQVATSLLKAGMLILFVCAAIWLVPAHGPVFRPQAIPAGLLGLAAAYQLIRGAYNGWHAPVYFAEETIAPARSVPRSLLWGILITATIFIGVNAALLRALGPSAMTSGPLPYLTILARVAGGWATVLFATGAMITAASCANASMMIAPRVLYALARDRLLPKAFQTVNKGGSPPLAFLLTVAVSIVLAMTGGFRLVFGMIATLATLAMLVTEIAYFVLRAREPDLARPWRAFLHPLLPGLVIAIDCVLLTLFVFADPKGALLAALLCALGVPFAGVARRMRTADPNR